MAASHFSYTFLSSLDIDCLGFASLDDTERHIERLNGSRGERSVCGFVSRETGRLKKKT